MSTSSIENKIKNKYWCFVVVFIDFYKSVHLDFFLNQTLDCEYYEDAFKRLQEEIRTNRVQMSIHISLLLNVAIVSWTSLIHEFCTEKNINYFILIYLSKTFLHAIFFLFLKFKIFFLFKFESETVVGSPAVMSNR